MFNFNDSRYTHMPFAAIGPDGNAKEFCCIQVNGQWKLYHFTGKNWKRVRTGLPADATECSPTAEFEDGVWKIDKAGYAEQLMKDVEENNKKIDQMINNGGDGIDDLAPQPVTPK